MTIGEANSTSFMEFIFKNLVQHLLFMSCRHFLYFLTECRINTKTAKGEKFVMEFLFIGTFPLLGNRTIGDDFPKNIHTEKGFRSNCIEHFLVRKEEFREILTQPW